jgi:mannose-6-phosphate isomerase
MSDIFRLSNKIRYYDWGSPDYIPHLLGENSGGKPWAELWMGIHPAGPSETEYQGKKIKISELIAGSPARFLGADAAKKFGSLPFLFKLLSADKPLSIQAHPDSAQAQEGWERENRLGIPIDDPKRNYKDSNHKPEILCALSSFTAMCGFRKPEEILKALAYLSASAPTSLKEGLAPLTVALENKDQGAALSEFFALLFNIPKNILKELSAFIIKTAENGTKEEAGTKNGGRQGEFSTEWNYAARFAGLFPGDSGVLSPFYLNLMELKPGEAICLGAGILHSYIQGFGVELMANSDNVLRGGLTNKHVDVSELKKILNFLSYKPKIITPDPGVSFFPYPSPFKEFTLSVLNGRKDSSDFPVPGPAIAIVTKGSMQITENGNGEVLNEQDLTLKQGESAFIPACLPPGALKCSGNFTAHIASLPAAGEKQHSFGEKGE